MVYEEVLDYDDGGAANGEEEEYDPTNPCYGDELWSPTSPTREYGGDSPVYEPEPLYEPPPVIAESPENPHGVISKYKFVPVNDTKSKLSILLANIQRHTGELLTAPRFLSSNNAEFPTTWDHNCWWCKHTFTASPVGLPIRYQKSTNTYTLHGMFCSYNCACAYAVASNRVETSRPLLFRLLMKQHKTIDKSIIEPAPHYTALTSFGGPLTIDEFRRQHCRDTRVVCLPMEHRSVPFGYNVYKLRRSELERQPPPPASVSASAKQPLRRTRRSAVTKTKATGPPPKRQRHRGPLPTVPVDNTYRMRRSAQKPSASASAISSMMHISFHS